MIFAASMESRSAISNTNIHEKLKKEKEIKRHTSGVSSLNSNSPLFDGFCCLTPIPRFDPGLGHVRKLSVGIPSLINSSPQIIIYGSTWKVHEGIGFIIPLHFFLCEIPWTINVLIQTSHHHKTSILGGTPPWGLDIQWYLHICIQITYVYI